MRKTIERSIGRGSKSNAMLRAKNQGRGVFSIIEDKSFAKDHGVKKLNSNFYYTKTNIEARAELSLHEFDLYWDWVGKQPSLVRINEFYARDYSSLGSVYDDNALGIAREFSWATARLSHYIDRVNKHVEYAKLIESAFWKNDYNSVANIISNYERDCGHSIWLLEIKLAVEQWFFGLESQKKLSDKMRSANRSGLIRFLVHNISLRNESSVTAERFEEIIEKKIEKLKNPHTKNYIRYRLLGIAAPLDEMAASILCKEQSHSIIDVYESILFIVQSFFKKNNTGKYPEFLSSGIDKLGRISDYRLDKIREKLELRHDCRSLKKTRSRSAEHLLSGNIRKAYRSYLKDNSVDFFDFRSVQAAAISCSILTDKYCEDRKSVKAWVVKELACFYSRRNEINDSFSRLIKFTLNFKNLPSGACLRSLVGTEKEKLPGIYYSYPVGADLNSCFVDGKSISLIKPDGNKHESLFDKFQLLWTTGKQLDADFPLPIVALSKARMHFQQGDIVAAVNDIDSILCYPIPLSMVAVAETALIDMLIESGDISRAVKTISRSALVTKVHPSQLNIEKALKCSHWRELSPLSLHISLPIALDLLSRDMDDSKLETYRRFALEEFLQSIGANKPSEINSFHVKCEVEEKIYFLRYVCIASNMAMIDGLNGTLALENERKDICSILGKMDKENADIYQNEIVSIIDKATIQQGLKLVDSSRVHVDTQDISKIMEKEISSDFARYKGLVGAGVGVAQDFDTVLKALIKTDLIDESILTIPDNEADDLLVSMIKRLADMFMSDHNYGLDSYLSKRVRHNSMTGYLRDIVAEVNLVTLKNDLTGEYNPNTYWPSKMPGLTEDQYVHIEDSLNKFTKSFDKINYELKTKYFTIKTQEQPDGVFELPIGSIEYHLLRSILQRKTDSSQFMQTCFDTFWGLLEPSLERARVLLSKKTKNDFSECFQRLLADLQTAPGGEGANIERRLLAEMITTIRDASLAVQSKLEVIAGWFNKSESSASAQIYTLEQTVDISIEAALTAHRAAELKIIKKIKTDSGVAIQSGSLFLIADILWIALDNACTRSGISKHVEVEVSASTNTDENLFEFKIINDVAPGVEVNNAEKVTKLTQEIAQGKHKDGLRKEGKSGLKKIAGLVSKSPNASLQFGFTSNGKFELLVKLPYYMLFTASDRQGDEGSI